MKIIHTGDIHLGTAFASLPPQKREIRKAELVDGFRRLCVYARDNGVAAVLIAGDLFDRNVVLPSLKEEVLRIIDGAAPVCFFYVSGNHDNDTEFVGKKPNNLYLFSDNHSWRSYKLPEGITITGIDTKNVSSEKYKELFLHFDQFNIVLMHGDVNQNSGKESIYLPALQGKGVNYLALGHIHIPTMEAQKLDGRGRYRYCGCLEGRGFDECGKKGCFLLDIQGGCVISEFFLQFSAREVAERAADISACKNYYDVERAVSDALKGLQAKDVVKVILKGKHQVGLKKDLPLLQTRLGDTFFHAKLVDESAMYVDYAAFEKDVSEVGEFVRVARGGGLSEEELAAVLDVGFKALAGEDIDL